MLAAAAVEATKPSWLGDFFTPLYNVASWFVGIFGGIIVGLLILLLGAILAALCAFVVVVAFIKIGDLISSWRFERARRKLLRRRQQIEDELKTLKKEH